MKVLRTGAVLIFLSVLLVVAGGAIAGPQGLKVALFFAVLMNAFSYFFSCFAICAPSSGNHFLPASALH